MAYFTKLQFSEDGIVMGNRMGLTLDMM